MDETPGDVEVGYGKPPRAHRFKKGQSGNLKGRPQKKKKLAPQCSESSVLKHFDREISVIVDGRATRISTIDALTRTLIAKASKGDVRALKMALELQKDAERSRQQKRNQLFATAAKYKSGWDREFYYLDQKALLRPPVAIEPSLIKLDYATGRVTVLPDGPLSCIIVHDDIDIESFIELLESTPPPAPRRGYDQISVEEKCRRIDELFERYRIKN